MKRWAPAVAGPVALLPPSTVLQALGAALVALAWLVVLQET